MDDAVIANEIQRLAQLWRDEPLFFGPVSEEVIGAAERELALTFPPSYRAFLSHLGAGFMIGDEFNGLPNTRDTDEEMPTFSHVVDSTKEEWKDSYGNPGLPAHLIHLMSDGGDYNYYLDASKRDDRGEYPVIVFGPGADGIVVAEDFLDFVRKRANRDDLF